MGEGEEGEGWWMRKKGLKIMCEGGGEGWLR